MEDKKHYSLTKEFFDIVAKDKNGYSDKKNSIPYRVQKRVRRIFMSLIESNSPSILDTGCEMGDFTLEIVQKFNTRVVIGLDFSKRR
ncbi:hypothetical protein KAW65_01095 [candidate division WOR-3 bacterium]|nr:hypothetical protein [candidate division WOR-3 bacterium]